MPMPKIRLIIAMPTRGAIDLHCASWLFSIQASMSYVAIKECMWYYSPFKAVADARNDLATQIVATMDREPDWEYWVLWVDDDMAPSADSLNKLFIDMVMHPNRDVVSGWFSRKNEGDPGIVFAKEDYIQMLPGRDFQIGKAVPVGWVGLAFTLMRGELLRKVPEPRFRCDPDHPLAGEDRWFCQQAKKVGANFWVHTGAPIGHASVQDKKVFWPNIGASEAVPFAAKLNGAVEVKARPMVETDITEHGSDYACAFLNCDNKEFADSMLAQLTGAPLILVLDNGTHLQEMGSLVRNDLKVIPTPENLGWGGGVNYLMDYVQEHFPQIKAVWVCNDDITGASPQVAQTLYDDVISLGAAVVCPSLTKTSQCSHKMMFAQEAGGIRQEKYVDWCAPMISIDAWKKVGPLDIEGFGMGHGLDIDWVQRARAMNMVFFVDDSVSITHEMPGQTCMAQGTLQHHVNNGWQLALVKKYGQQWDQLVR